MESIVEDIQVIEKDLENVNDKCKKVNCSAVYDAIVATLNLIYDSIACCFKNCYRNKKEE